MNDRDRNIRDNATQDALDRAGNREERANQADASRPGVDAEHGGAPGVPDAETEGSVFEPKRTSLDAIDDSSPRGYPGEAVHEDPSAYVQQGHDIQNRTGRQAVKDSGTAGSHGLDGPRDTTMSGGGGSEFQPLAKDPHAGVHFDDSGHRPGGSAQDQQDLSRRGREWREGDAPRDETQGRDQRRP